MKRKILTLLALVISATIGYGQSFTNGGFAGPEAYSTSPVSWGTFSGSPDVVTIPSGLGVALTYTAPGAAVSSQGGNFTLCYEASSGASTERFQQDVTGLTIGQTYTITFEEANFGPCYGANCYTGTGQFLVYVSGLPVMSSGNTLVVADGWQIACMSFTATATTHTIGFEADYIGGGGTGAWMAIDNIQLNVGSGGGGSGAGYNYPSTTLCTSAPDATPVITGTPGGTFTSTPVGLTINATTGIITPGTSTVGSYDVTYTTAGACFSDSTLVINIAANPVVDPIGDQTVCAGDLFTDITFTGSAGATFDWVNDNTATALAANGTGDITGFAGTATVGQEVSNITVTPSAGSCVGTDETFILTVNPQDDPAFNYSASSYCSTDTDPSAAITGTAGGTFTSTAGIILDASTGLIDLDASAAGSYDITYTTAGPCPQSSVVTVDITILVTDFSLATYCINDTDPLPTFIGLGVAGTFTSAPVGLSINPGTGEVDLDASTAGTYTVTNTINVAGCAISTFDDDITINELPTASISGDAVNCQGVALPDVVIDITAGIANWNLTYNLDGTAVNSAGITATPFTITGAEGIYDLVSITDGNGCTNTIAGQVVQELLIMPVMNTLVDQEICEGDNLDVQGFSALPAGATFDWSNTTGIDVGFGLSGIGNVGTFLATNGTGADVPVTVEVTPTSVDGCVGLAETFEITIHPRPVVSFMADTVVGCEPLLVEFTNTSSPVGNNCTWSFGDGNTAIGCSAVSNTYMAGLHDVSLNVITADGCAESLTMNDYINVMAMPVAQFSYNPQVTTIDDTEIAFTNSSLFADAYEWNFGDNTSLFSGENPIHIYPEVPGSSYEVQLVASNNGGLCADTTHAIVYVQDVIVFYLPNSFTPDGDAFNESFQPVFTSGHDPYDFHFMIFNRWGEMVFESYNAASGWDGHYGDGGLVDDGTYVWKLDFKETMSDKRHTHHGHVTVLK